MAAGSLVDIVISPGILGNHVGLKIRAVPVLRVARLGEQVTQRLGIIGVIYFEIIQGGAERGDLCDSGLLFGLFASTGEAGNNDCSKDAENNEDQKEFDERETATRTTRNR